MKPMLQIKTQCQQQDVGDEPVSPTGQYLNSKAVSVSIICILESEIPMDNICAMDLLEKHFLPINPRFSSIMVSNRNGVKQWKRVEVNLHDHINIPEFPNSLSIKEYDDLFNKYVSNIAMEQLPQDRPLWEVHIMKYPTSNAAGHLIFKLHHALGDGYSLMGVLFSCMKRADNPSLPLSFPSLRSCSTAKTSKTDVIRRVPQALSTICNTISDFGWSILKSSLIEDDKTPIRSGADNVEFNPVKISTATLSLDKISDIKTKLGVTVNDVVVATTFLGTRLYMQEFGKEFGHSQSTALVVLNTRNVNGYKSVQEMLRPTNKSLWGNQFAFLQVGIPELINDQSSNPLHFVTQVHKTIKRKKSSLAVYLIGQTLEMIRKLGGPEAGARFIHSTFKKSSIVISNVVGPIEQMAVDKHPFKGLYFTLAGGPQSLLFTVISYMRTLRICVTAEGGYIDSQRIISCIDNAFELIDKAAHDSTLKGMNQQSLPKYNFWCC